MLTELRLTNFKAFGETQRIPIKPLTLIFGANSSGKSSIVHGMLFLQHLLQGGAVDAGEIGIPGMGLLDLGGYQDFVHRHEISRNVELRISLGSSTCSTLAEFQRLPDEDAPAELYLTIGKERPKSRKEGGAGEALIKRVQVGFQEWLARKAKSSPASHIGEHELTNLIEIAGGKDAIEKTAWQFLMSNRSVLRLEHNVTSNHHLAQALREGFMPDTAYLGPLRYYPPRIELLRIGREKIRSELAGGMVWALLGSDKNLQDLLNRALLRFGIPYRIDMRAFKTLRGAPYESALEVSVTDPQGTRLSLRDIGMGVSQVIPVIAVAVIAQHILSIVEQPELHIHPKLQAELGDVFIESALGARKNTFVLETHSEHLILRILRRIRETTEGKDTGLPPIQPKDVSVLYVQPGPKGAEVTELPVTPDGDFAEPWPDGFFPERAQELF